MKFSNLLLWLMVAALLAVSTGCASQTKAKVSHPETARDTAQIQSAQTNPAAGGSTSGLSPEEEALFSDEFEEDSSSTPQNIHTVSDPIEPFNRAIYRFNDTMYEWVLRPISLGYRKVTPQKMRTGVQNFFSNLLGPARTVNCILQGKGRAAGAEISKFLFNTTYGVLGFMDLFTDYPEMYPDREDLGQSLAVYGIGDGFYLVLPFLGPSTLRDTVGLVGDGFLDPVNYLDNTGAVLSVKGYNTVNRLSFRIEDIDDAKKAAFDPYEAARNFYIQSRRNRIKK